MPTDSVNTVLEEPFGVEEIERMVEAIVFASRLPVKESEIVSRLPVHINVKPIITSLKQRYQKRGVHLVKVGQSWAFRTAPDLGYLMSREKIIPRKLSRAALETLAIIAYHQPVSRAEIEEIRGVGLSRGTINILLECEWIGFGKRRNTLGRPVTYVVTERFLDHFGLTSVNDLPGLKELRKAGLLEQTNPNPHDQRSGDNSSLLET